MGNISSLVFVAFACLWLNCSSFPQGDSLVPCFYIFGDSLVDSGNNNHLITFSKANYVPYGIDFPGHIPTGRFTNGRTFADVLTQLLGFPKFIPPFSRTIGRALLKGANFASGASGIRDESGYELGKHISMNEQVKNYARVVQEMRFRFRRNDTAVADYSSKCLYYVNMGSNDYLNNYFMPEAYKTSSNYTPEAYAEALLEDYAQQLTNLYNFGARKVVVAAVGKIACIPFELARYEGGPTGSKCNEKINDAIALFNKGLVNLVDQFNNGELPGSKFVFFNTYDSQQILVKNAASYGFKVFDRGCCGVGKNNGAITCLPGQTPCKNREKYIYWDAFHPTEAVNVVMANISFLSESKAVVYPMNIKELALL